MNDDMIVKEQSNTRNYTRQILIIVMAVYVVLGAITAIVFYANGSYIQASADKEMKYNLYPDKETQTAVREPGKEEAESAGEEEAVAENTAAEEPVAEPSKEPAESATVSAPSAAKAEVPKEPEEEKFYSFVVVTTDSWLNIRENPDTDSKVVGHFGNASTGYVLKKGDEFSLVTNGYKTGYVNNDYLTLTEISAEDYPEKYR